MRGRLGSWAIVPPVLLATALLTLLSPPVPGLSAAGTGIATTVAPAGQNATLTPPTTWCTVTNVSGGQQYSCSDGGALTLQLNVTHLSELVGTVSVTGPFAVWLSTDAWLCPLSVQLTGYFHPCPIPFDPPLWHDWSQNFTAAGSLDLAALPLNITSSLGVLPPAAWTLLFVDSTGVNETATVVAPVGLVSA